MQETTPWHDAHNVAKAHSMMCNNAANAMAMHKTLVVLLSDNHAALLYCWSSCQHQQVEAYWLSTAPQQKTKWCDFAPKYDTGEYV